MINKNHVNVSLNYYMKHERTKKQKKKTTRQNDVVFINLWLAAAFFCVAQIQFNQILNGLHLKIDLYMLGVSSYICTSMKLLLLLVFATGSVAFFLSLSLILGGNL